jgi:hypothetical protein
MMIMLLSKFRTEGWWGLRALAVAVRWACLLALASGLPTRGEADDLLSVAAAAVAVAAVLMVTSRNVCRSSRVCRPCWNLCRMWVKSCCCCRAEEESDEEEVEEEAELVVEVE